jgi:hypothetical protein
MHPDRAQLSSIGTAIAELTERVTAIADRHAGSRDDETIASGLYDVERNLKAATRRLDAVIRHIA